MKPKIEAHRPQAAGKLCGWWGGLTCGVSAMLAVGAVAWLVWSGRADIQVALRGGAGSEAAWLPSLKAELGTGEYLFLPCRKEMWVINRTQGKIIHYHFFDNEQGTVERTRVAQVKTDVFPSQDTDYAISDRNLNSYLWVSNRVTGDFQFLKATRDGTINADSEPVSAGDDLRGIPFQRERQEKTPRKRREGTEASR